MKAPADLDPDVRTVLEIVQHAAEILSRVPLSALRSHLQQHHDDSPHVDWYRKALNVTLAAEQLDAAQGILFAEEARLEVTVQQDELRDAARHALPDDWTTG